MKESEAKHTVLALLVLGTLASAYLAPPEIMLYAVFGYIGLFALVEYLKNGVAFGQRIYPWGIKYSEGSRKMPGLNKRKPPKKGKQYHKRK